MSINIEIYSFLLGIYTRIEVESLEIKNKRFNSICDILVKNTNIKKSDILSFNNILYLINDKIFNSILSLIRDNKVNESFIIIREYFKLKYDEKLCFDILDNFHLIIKYYNENANDRDIYKYIIEEKSSSENEDIATEGKLKYIKYKRNDIKYSYSSNYDDDLPF